jgi:DNA-binding NarL/FixJ family response regulator
MSDLGEVAELSRHDVELLRLLAGGLPLDEVARRAHTSQRPVRRRRLGVICGRMGFRASIQAAARAVWQGLV